MNSFMYIFEFECNDSCFFIYLYNSKISNEYLVSTDTWIIVLQDVHYILSHKKKCSNCLSAVANPYAFVPSSLVIQVDSKRLEKLLETRDFFFKYLSVKEIR